MWFRLLVVGIIAFFVGKFYGQREREEELFEEKSSVPKKSVVFEYQNKNAKKVVLTGDFNNWDISSDQMFDLGDGNWSITMFLEPGRYEYKYVVDDTEWIADPNAKEFVDDGYGGKRSVVIVQ